MTDDWSGPRLVLSLKLGTYVQIGEVSIQMLARKGNTIRVAIAAPRDMEIIRNAPESTVLRGTK